MREIIGVESWISILGVNYFLKKDALFFDKIAIPHLSYFLHILETVQEQEPKFYEKFSKSLSIDNCLREIHWLLDNGFLFETTQQFDNQQLSGNIDFLNNLSQVMSFLPVIKELVENESRESVEKMIQQFLKGDFDIVFDIRLKEVFGKVKDIVDTTNRLFAIQLREIENLEAYPILLSEMSVNSELEAKKTDVVQITLNNLPIPSEMATWEQIKEFRSDNDSKQKFLDLRNWMNEVARAKLTPLEIEQKLEYLVNQYKRQVNIHKLKTNTGTFETILVSGSEILEDLARVKFSKAIKALFSVKHRKIELMEKELNAKGSEIAYIIKAQNKFM